ncbi:OmpA family protein [Sinorhizobium sp. BG8]|uniref:OmpA family protein n=1 Tax=Sinorhizobium sp. BG8 TaxID=2613773 RepID=UPI00193DD004|nr:OmpA family protein [Sinorhizobium sp. BG8]QRM55701.1 OmpA family protein [Sinorhizobium sp. BG8]
MGNRTKLLATVALPLVSLVWQPSQAATMHVTMDPAVASQVITVQADPDMSPEELRKLRRQQNQERQQQKEQQGERQKQREERRKESQQQEQNQGTWKTQQEERRKKQQQEERQQQKEQQGERQKQREQRQQEEQRQSERSKQQQEERRKKSQQAEEQQQQERKQQRQEEQQQGERQKQREERSKSEQRQQEEQKSDRQKQREERSREAERQQEEQNQETWKTRQEERRKAQQAEERRQEEEQQSDRRKKQDAERQQSDKQDAAGERPRRKKDPEREKIARDPSRTTETVDLPIEGGAAVLDSDKDADRQKGLSRAEQRKKRAEERQNVKVRVPKSDADSQVDRDGNRRRPVKIESAEREKGRRFDRRPEYNDREGMRVERRYDNRTVYYVDNRVIVRSDDRVRLARNSQHVYYEGLEYGRVREVIERPNGERIVTIRDRYGDIIQRSRINNYGQEFVMFYAPEIDRMESRPPFRDPGLYLPPMRLSVPVEDYIIDTSTDVNRDYEAFLDAPPVEPVERVYSLDEVKYSARIRDKVRRIDLDTITFATGSAEISMSQASSLRRVADAINEILEKDPSETFLVEGHTDAVGSDESNLVLSDERAEAVANVLTDVYGIQPENLATQGYGERFLKVETDGPEQLNRRVTIRRVTPLVKPVASAE